MRRVLFYVALLMSLYFTLNLCVCTTEFRGYTADGKKLINYEFASSHVEWQKEFELEVVWHEVETVENEECNADGWCCSSGYEDEGYDCGYAWDCNGYRDTAIYDYKTIKYHEVLKLVGGREINGVPYYKKVSKTIKQTPCIQIKTKAGDRVERVVGTEIKIGEKKK
ncbi:MAG: hypothetical protein JSW73_00515 [Candidatus Woesearchaeota archaeon]|nr:MAG: hypothetical protein JSW73_00515 [Candidatus Woesearchaeota archaeon]